MSNVRQRRPVAESVDVNRDEEQEDLDEGPRGWWTAALIALVAAIILTPFILVAIPSPLEAPVSFSYPEAPKFEGPLEENGHLLKAEKIHENKLLGPESIVVDGDHIYTGTADGKILHIYRGEIQTLAKLGSEPCGGFEDEPTCGRPLGMRLDKNGYLIVVDAYLGLFKINVATGDVHKMWSSSFPVSGSDKKSTFLNDLTISEDGTIYISESSTKWDRRHNRYCIMEAEKSGRVLIYRPDNGTMEVLVSGIGFANGIQLSKREDFLIIVETTMARILKYHLKGANVGRLEVLVDNLPGTPDNIRPSSTGNYWLGMATIRKGGTFSFLDFAASRPWLRDLVTKLVSQETIMRFLPKYGLVIEINDKGEILRSLHDPTGKHIPCVSEVEDKDGVLYLGSYNLPFISRLYLRKL